MLCVMQSQWVTLQPTITLCAGLGWLLLLGAWVLQPLLNQRNDPCLIIAHPCVMLQLRGDPVGP